MFRSRISLNHVSFAFPNSDQLIIADCHLTLSANRYGLVGQNGAGKSTLMDLILNKLQPTKGQIETVGKVIALTQNQAAPGQTVAEILNVKQKLQALQSIEAGNVDPVDFEIVGEDWDLHEKIDAHFLDLGLQSLPLEQSFDQLSGGERTRLFLVHCLLQEPDFLLLDEPTNNLDYESRQALYQFIDNWDKGLLVASHDRELLRHVDHIVALTTVGIFQYGGNYNAYVEQKETEMAAREHRAHAQLERLEKRQSQVKRRMDTHSKAAAKGVRAKKSEIKAKGTYDKLVIKKLKGQSERTQGRLKKQFNRQLNEVEDKLKKAKAAIPINESLSFALPKPFLPSGKTALDIEQLTFGYDKPLFKSFNFNISGPERIGLSGPNGAGKSTLIRLILNQLKPQSGTIKVGVEQIAYLDQFCSSLDDSLTVLENFKQFNPDQNQTECHQNLAHFKFRNQQALMPVKQLSGGERLRALLACVLMSSNPPQLLILDEPTNHLDLESIQYLETVLAKFEGAMLVVSHDQDFLFKISCNNTLTLG